MSDFVVTGLDSPSDSPAVLETTVGSATEGQSVLLGGSLPVISSRELGRSAQLVGKNMGSIASMFVLGHP